MLSVFIAVVIGTLSPTDNVIWRPVTARGSVSIVAKTAVHEDRGIGFVVVIESVIEYASLREKGDGQNCALPQSPTHGSLFATVSITEYVIVTNPSPRLSPALKSVDEVNVGSAKLLPPPAEHQEPPPPP